MSKNGPVLLALVGSLLFVGLELYLVYNGKLRAQQINRELILEAP